MIRPKQACRVFSYRNVEAIHILPCHQVAELTPISKLIPIVAVGSDLHLQDSVVVGRVLDFQQLDEVTLDQCEFTHFAFAEVVAGKGDYVLLICVFVVVNCS